MIKRQHRSLAAGPAEQTVSVIVLFFTTGALVPFIAGDVDPTSPLAQLHSTPIHLAFTLGVYSLAFCFIATRWRSVLQSAWNIKWITALLMLTIASMAWSQDPLLTLRMSATLLATSAFGVYFGTRYSVAQQLRLLAWTCFLAVSLSFFFAIFLPSYGLDAEEHFGTWQGAFSQKNALAETMVLAVLVFFFLRLKRFPWLRWVGVAASAALLLLSQSATGLIVCGAIIAALPLYRLIRNQWRVAVPVAAFALVVVGSLLFLNVTVAEALQFVGRSPDMTGRTELWDAVLLSIAKRPWLGYGFGAFWRGVNGESGVVLDTIGWMPAYAHNGFLDLILQLGVLGLVTFVVGYLVIWRRALACLSRATGPVPMWLCTFLVLMLLYNLTEGSILTQNNIYWVLYISTAVSLSAASSRRLRAR